MKRMKQVVSLALAAAMALSMTACGGSGNSKDDASADVFKIGGTGPITGESAIYGEAVKNGIQIAVDEINEAGGINGYQIEYKFEDDEADAEKGVNAYNALKDWGMQVLVGATTSGATTAIAAETANDNMFQITPSGSSTDCIEGKTNVFQVCFTDPNQGGRSAEYIDEHNLATKIAVIYDSSEAYSSGIYSSFKKEAEARGLQIVAEGSFTADNNKDFNVQLQQAKDAGADLIFLPIYYSQAALILAQADAMGYDPTFFGCDGMDGILGVENFDTSLAEGLMLLTPFVADADDEATQNFVATYEANYGETPIQFAADAYDAVYIIKAAVEKADVTPADSVSDICDALKAAMLEINVQGLTGDEGGMTWEATGEVSKAPKAAVIVNGKYSMAQ